MFNDLRFALRQLLKNPGFTAVAVLTLALGIGANTAIFSTVNGVLLKPLPYSEPGQLVMVYEDESGDGRGLTAVAGGVFIDWKEQATCFDALSVISGTDMNLTGGEVPERLSGSQVSASFLNILRVKPIIGRGFSADEDQLGQDNKVVILSYELWQRRFGGNQSFVGRSIRLSGEQYTVIGVLPPKAPPFGNAQFLVPFVFGTDDWQKSRDDQRFMVIARLKAGISLAQANAELKALKQRLLPVYSKGKQKWGFQAKSVHEVVTSDVKPTLLMLFGAVGFVLLIAAANVANLLLAKAASRQKEMAIRAALGASRWRVMRQVLTESVVLAALGGGLGVLLAYLGVDALSKLREETLPLAREVAVSSRVLAFSVLVSLVTGIVFGLMPALRACAPDLNTTLKESSRGSTTSGHNRVRASLIVSEVALAVVLLVGSGLLLRSFWNLWNSPTGFNPHNALALDISLPETKYPTGERQARFLDQIIERIEALPGVEAASEATTIPMIGWSLGSPVKVEGRVNQPEEGYGSAYDFVASHYFRALGIPVLRGRDFAPQDNSTNSPRVCVFNDALAEKVFPKENPIGQRIRFWGDLWEVVGVVGSVRHNALNAPAYERIYLPQAFSPWTGTLIVRTKSKPMQFAEAIRKEILALDAEQPISNVRTLEDTIAKSVAGRSFALLLLGLFAAVALGLAAIGLYGVLAFAVTQRTNEIGIRMALGAGRPNVVMLVVKHGMALTLLGVCIGLCASFGLTRIIQNQLYQVGPADPVSFGIVTVVLLLVALLACWIPARRASRVDPMTALRCE